MDSANVECLDYSRYSRYDGKRTWRTNRSDTAGCLDLNLTLTMTKNDQATIRESLDNSIIHIRNEIIALID